MQQISGAGVSGRLKKEYTGCINQRDNNTIGEELKPKHALLTSIWRFPPERSNTHPAPFPLELPIRCIYSVMDEAKNGLVLDPYCGSGTTLVAARILGYEYVGIDISEDYCHVAEKRITNYKNKEPIAMEEMQKHIVMKTFKERKQNGEFTGRYGKHNKQKVNEQQLLKFF